MNRLRILVPGAGPIINGQAAEFDYSGSQCCSALREAGHTVVLVNSNPATIQTDPETADIVYIEPMTVESLKRIIEKEKPDAIIPGMGGQTGLNLTVDLHKAGVLQKYGVKILGTSLKSIEMAEDRDLFRKKMVEIGEPVAESGIAKTISQSLKLAEKLDYPVVVRPAFTLGGTGGGIAYDESELDTSSVHLLTKVTIRNTENDMQLTYAIVPESEADLLEKKISVESPIAQGLLGKKVGEIAEIQVPSGIMKFEIVAITT